jgi:hypothetical protein
MNPEAKDNPVPRVMLTLLSDERLIVRETQRAVTPFGGVVVLVSFLQRIDLVGQIRTHMPVRWRSPNQIDPAATLMAFLMAVLVGARHFVHANWLRGDRALHALLGMARFPSDDTIRNLFRRFGMGEVHQLYAPLADWQMQRLPWRAEGYSLDLDSTVFERYGEQEGALKGHNPRKHGRNALAVEYKLQQGGKLSLGRGHGAQRAAYSSRLRLLSPVLYSILYNMLKWRLAGPHIFCTTNFEG